MIREIVGHTLRGLGEGFLAVKTGKKSPASQGKRVFQAGKNGNLNADWRTDNVTINRDLRTYLRKIRERSRDMTKNSPFGIRIQKLIRTNVVGPEGVKLQVKPLYPDGTLDEPASDLIEAAWKKWGSKGNCEVTRQMSWRQIQHLTAITINQDGECLLRHVENYANPGRYALQFIDVDLLDIDKNQPKTSRQNEIVMGIEMDSWGAPLLYHFRNTQIDNGGIQQITWTHPARDIIHIFDPVFVGQNRGYPGMAPAIPSLRQLEAYEDAEVVAARVAACKMAVETTSTDANEFAGDRDDVSGGTVNEMSPAEWVKLDPGQQITALNFDHPTTAFEGFVKRIIERLASSFGVSYASFSGDLSQVNYSSIRWGGLDEREYFKLLQQDLIEGLCAPVFSRWLEIQLLGQLIPLPAAKLEKFNAPFWMPKRWPWVDPLKEVEASVKALENRLTTFSDEVADRGDDWGDLLKRFKQDTDAAKAKGVTLPALNPQPTQQQSAKQPEGEPQNAKA